MDKTLPDKGANKSDTVFTASTSPKEVPQFTLEPISGNSTKITSPN